MVGQEGQNKLGNQAAEQLGNDQGENSAAQDHTSVGRSNGAICEETSEILETERHELHTSHSKTEDGEQAGQEENNFLHCVFVEGSKFLMKLFYKNLP